MVDEGEFDAFYASTAPRLVSQLYLMTRDLTEAQDCVQEAYTRAWERWPAIGKRDGEDPAAWVWTVAWRIAVSRWRRTRTHLRVLSRHGPPPEVPGPSADVVAVRTALHQLPAAQRAAIVLHYFGGLSVQEIAAVLGVPGGTVKARLSRGRTALAALLTDVEEPVDHLHSGQEQHHAR